MQSEQWRHYSSINSILTCIYIFLHPTCNGVFLCWVLALLWSVDILILHCCIVLLLKCKFSFWSGLGILTSPTAVCMSAWLSGLPLCRHGIHKKLISAVVHTPQCLGVFCECVACVGCGTPSSTWAGQLRLLRQMKVSHGAGNKQMNQTGSYAIFTDTPSAWWSVHTFPRGYIRVLWL